ncbi:MAG: hypothetical protein J1D85_04585 [Bacteroidales bacterium]|nr:hypothetical protein [Bacteroidales bacterium]
MLCIFAAAAMLASAPACSPKTHVGGPETDDTHGQTQTTPGENSGDGNGNGENGNGNGGNDNGNGNGENGNGDGNCNGSGENGGGGNGNGESGGGGNGSDENGNSENENRQEDDNMIVSIYIGDKKFEAEIEDSETGRAFMDKLPLDLDMKELNGNEKYCYGVPLPQDAKHCPSIEAGDLMLYGKDCIVLFYAPAGGYSYTRIGRLKSVSGLKEAVGSSDVCVKFCI